MGKTFSIGVNATARKGKAAWIGVNGMARKIKKMWIGVNGVAREFYTSGNRLKYVCYFSSDSGGNILANIKKYELDSNTLTSETNLSTATVNQYEDDCIRIKYQELSVKYRYVFTPKAAGTTSVQGSYNYGSEYGGTGSQICPYTLGGDTCTITFTTSQEH